MGMFDIIKFRMECPRCKKDMGEFQSKDKKCYMELLDFWEVNNFYTSCEHCRTWVEFTIKGKRPNRKLTIKDYKKVIEKTNKKDDAEYKERMGKWA